jgi:hypothetical protein
VTTDLVARDEADLTPRFVISLEELRQQIVALDQFKRDIMQDGTDYAVIPGTPRPSLLKPGAEKLCEAFGWRPNFAILDSVREWERGFFHYEVECRLLSKRTGEEVGNGLGEANSLEGRYRWREARPNCEQCGFELRRARDRAEWYCWRARGGCGATYPQDKIAPGGKVENDDPYTLVNTLLKMAQKRALVAATLVAAAASGIFTQDVEDWVLEPSGQTRDDDGLPTGREAAPPNGNAKPNGIAREAAFSRQSAGGIGRSTHSPLAANGQLAPAPADANGCAACGQPVQSHSLAKTSQVRYGALLCATHFNARAQEEYRQDSAGQPNEEDLYF